MTNEDIERVARAICREAYLDDSSWPIFVLVARTAIAAMEPQWRDIETAPKNGERILASIKGVKGSERIVRWYWLDDIEIGWVSDINGKLIADLTHWMEIPELPK